MTAFKLQALHFTILSNTVEMASFLLENGAELHDLANDPLIESPFQTATTFNRLHFLHLFLHHADKRWMHISLEIFYNKAIEYDSEECAIFTLQQGYHPRWSVDFSSNMSCFHKASGYGLIKLMSFILSPTHISCKKTGWYIRTSLLDYRSTQTLFPGLLSKENIHHFWLSSAGLEYWLDWTHPTH